jgi:hypothetical protein
MPNQARKLRKNELRVPLSALESKGRKIGAVIGSWVTDLAELRQEILLCSACDPKFAGTEARYGYHRDTKWKKIYGGVIAKCDACREMGHGRRMYVHESYFGVTYDP